MSKVLVVIDMQEGFCTAGYPLYIGPAAQKVIAFIKGKIDEYNGRGDWVFFTRDEHLPDDPEFKMFPPHCIKGTIEAEIVDSLRTAAKRSEFFPKRRFSGFYGTNLDEEISKLRPDQVEVVGVCTNICVMYTVEELRNRDYEVVVCEEGVASFDLEAHQFALKQMSEVLGAKVV